MHKANNPHQIFLTKNDDRFYNTLLELKSDYQDELSDFIEYECERGKSLELYH